MGDLAGFAAATFLRGIGFLQLPTTLLAAVDSSVGGKTAIDLTNGKNLAGAFYQPQAVLCDLDTLDTLPAEVFADGCAEVIKYGMIGDPALLARLETVDFRADPEELVARCVAQKRDLVEQDEFDTGARQLLNLGHTLGHGVEACSGYTVSHGRAVAIGMTLVTRAAVAFGRCPAEVLPACGGCWSGMACRTPPPIRPRRCMRKPCRTKSGPETPFLWWYPLPGAPASWCGFPCQNCRRG
ncbi:MAG: 3-dehydroquinate synthase family protein [Evtepia gabavorous]